MLITLLSVVLLSSAAAEPPTDWQHLVGRSRFIFEGSIVALNAATMPIVPVTRSTAIVRVEEIFRAPEDFGDFRGLDITVQLMEPDTAEVGQSLIFFTNGWLYGESIAVVEVGHLEVTAKPTEVRELIADALSKQADQELLGRIESASLVVAGRVSVVKPAPREVRGVPASEHDPDFYECVIQVSSIEKGAVSGSTVSVLFPKSTDVMWDRAPKFHEGQTGIWILRKEKIEGLAIENYYTALDPLDFHSSEELDRIRGLTKQGDQGPF